MGSELSTGHAEKLEFVPIVPTEIFLLLLKSFALYARVLTNFYFKNLPDPQARYKTETGRDPSVIYSSQIYISPYKPVFLPYRRGPPGHG